MAQYIYTMNRVAKVVPPKRFILRDISLSFFPVAKIGVLELGEGFRNDLGYYRRTGVRKWFTDAGLRHLRALTQLQRLSLAGQFTDAGLVHLSALRELQRLDLTSSRVTGTGLEQPATGRNARPKRNSAIPAAADPAKP